MGELKPDKGLANGSCNRAACQQPLTHEPEHQFMEDTFTGGPRLFYCADCASAFDRVDEDMARRGMSSLGPRIQREPKTKEANPHG